MKQAHDLMAERERLAAEYDKNLSMREQAEQALQEAEQGICDAKQALEEFEQAHLGELAALEEYQKSLDEQAIEDLTNKEQDISELIQEGDTVGNLGRLLEYSDQLPELERSDQGDGEGDAISNFGGVVQTYHRPPIDPPSLIPNNRELSEDERDERIDRERRQIENVKLELDRGDERQRQQELAQSQEDQEQSQQQEQQQVWDIDRDYEKEQAKKALTIDRDELVQDEQQLSAPNEPKAQEQEQGRDEHIWDIDRDYEEQREKQQEQSLEERKRDLGDDFSL